MFKNMKKDSTNEQNGKASLKFRKKTCKKNKDRKRIHLNIIIED